MTSTAADSPTSTSTQDAALETYKDLVENYVEDSFSISKGAKIGIAVGCSVVGLIIIFMIFLIVRKMRRSKKEEKLEVGNNGDGTSGGGSNDDLTEADRKRIEAFNTA